MGGEVPEPRRQSHALSVGCSAVPEEALHLVLGYVDDPRDREAASLVCRHWHRIDALSRKHVTVGFCYAMEPTRLLARKKERRGKKDFAGTASPRVASSA